MLLGLDFDNTLICYDHLFYIIARERGLIPASTPADKNAVRNTLRRQNQEDEWTRIQGEVYGARINEAEPFEGMLDTLVRLQQRGLALCLVSHKTRTPYLGPEYDLHAAARGWLARQGFFDARGLGWQAKQVFFEVTQADKVRRIISLQCTHYIDDLPEVLDRLPNAMTRILFAPAGDAGAQTGWRVFHAWKDLPSMIP